MHYGLDMKYGLNRIFINKTEMSPVEWEVGAALEVRGEQLSRQVMTDEFSSRCVSQGFYQPSNQTLVSWTKLIKV